MELVDAGSPVLSSVLRLPVRGVAAPARGAARRCGIPGATAMGSSLPARMLRGAQLAGATTTQGGARRHEQLPPVHAPALPLPPACGRAPASLHGLRRERTASLHDHELRKEEFEEFTGERRQMEMTGGPRIWMRV